MECSETFAVSYFCNELSWVFKLTLQLATVTCSDVPSVHAKNKTKNIVCQEEIYCRQKGLYDMWRPLSPTKVLCTPPKVREREKGCKGQTGVRKRVVQQDAGWCLILLLFQVRIFTSFPEVPSKLRTAVGTSPEHGDHHIAPELERGNQLEFPGTKSSSP